MVLSREKLSQAIYSSEDLAGDLVELLAEQGHFDDGSSKRRGLMPSLLSSHGISAALPNLRDYRGGLRTRGLQIANLDDELLENGGFDVRVGAVFTGPDMRRIADLDNLRQLLSEGKLKEVKPQNGKILLEPDVMGRKVYYVLSYESVCLPENLELRIDSRSSTGRVAGMCGGHWEKFFNGMNRQRLITALQPFAFPLLVTVNKTSLFQVALRYWETGYMSRADILENQDSVQLFIDEERVDLSKKGRISPEGLKLTYNTHKVFRARPINKIPEPIDMDAIGVYRPEDYYDLIEGDGEIKVEKNRFYLFPTQERVQMGSLFGFLSRESYDDPGVWGHFAGFFKSLYNGEITMEVMSYFNRIIRRGQEAGRVQFDKLDRELEEGEGYAGVYQGQRAPRLPKMFSQAA